LRRFLCVLAAIVGMDTVACQARAQGVTEFALPRSESLPHRIALGADGNMWFTEQTGHSIGRISPAGVISEFPLPQGRNSFAIAAGPDGNMWFTEARSNRIGRIDPSGAIVEFSTGLSSRSNPGEITAGPDRALWFLDQDGGKIGRITTSGAIAEFPVVDGSTLNGIASDSKNVWFTVGVPTYEVGVFNVRSHAVKTFAMPEGSSFPEGIAIERNGTVWFTLPNDHLVGKIGAGAKIVTFTLPDDGGYPGSPSQIVAGPDGNIWFTEFNQSRVGRIDADGKLTEYSDGISSMSSPDGLAFGRDGNVWFTEYNGNQIGKL
jgi:streptogramin lyase